MAGRKLYIEPSLEADLRALVETGGAEAALALQAFLAVVWGVDAPGHEPLYEGSARRVWRVAGIAGAEIDVHVFDWGGDHLGIPPLRVWYLEDAHGPPRGIGAFPATPGPEIAERDTLLDRARRLLEAPACVFVEA